MPDKSYFTTSHSLDPQLYFAFIYTTISSLTSGVRRKFSWGGHSVAYGGHLFVVCTLCDVTI